MKGRMMIGLIYRGVTEGERLDTLVGWAETNDVRYDLRTINNKLQVGMSAYHWRKAEYIGVAA
jgi:hypothetical protein